MDEAAGADISPFFIRLQNRNPVNVSTMKSYSYSLVIGLLAFSLAAMGQERNIAVRLNTPDYYSGIKGRSITSSDPCVNGMPLAVSLGRSGVTEFGNAVLYLIRLI